MIRRVISLAVLVMTLLSCEESVDGCLDIRATNFDVSAVTSCESCCAFPAGSLDLDFKFDTLDLSFNTDYPLGLDTIQLNSIELPFSKFKLLGSGQEFSFIDSILRFSPRMRDDYVLIERVAQDIGHTDYVALIDSIECLVGIDVAELNQLRPFIDISSGNNVNLLISNLYDESQDLFVQARMEVEIADSVRFIEIQSIANPMIAFSDTIDILQGRNWRIDWELDVKKMLEGISPEDTNEQIGEIISQNLTQAISKS